MLDSLETLAGTVLGIRLVIENDITVDGNLSLINTEVFLSQNAELNVGQLNIGPNSQVSGGGVINGDVENTGTVQVEIASLQVAGTYTQTDTGRLLLGIDDLSSEDRFGQLIISDAATLDGSLFVNATNDFVPIAGVTFSPITFQSVSGLFVDLVEENLSDFNINIELFADRIDLELVEA